MPYKYKKKTIKKKKSAYGLSSNNTNNTNNNRNPSKTIRNSSKTIRNPSKTIRNSSKTIRNSVERKTYKSHKRNPCNHWFRLDNKDKVDCLLKDGKEYDTVLKKLIASSQGYRRIIVERFLNDEESIDYFKSKTNKEIKSLLKFFMILQGGEYSQSYGMPSQIWLDICIKASKNNI